MLTAAAVLMWLQQQVDGCDNQCDQSINLTGSFLMFPLINLYLKKRNYFKCDKIKRIFFLIDLNIANKIIDLIYRGK